VHNSAGGIATQNAKAERVFVNLEAVYPKGVDQCQEYCFEELRAMSRGWTTRDWRMKPPTALRTIAINLQESPSKETSPRLGRVTPTVEHVREDSDEVNDENAARPRSSSHQQAFQQEQKPVKPKRIRVKEIKQETQTGEFFPLQFMGDRD
jgi:checkpoint serine/threonine-protein kinase